MNQSKYRYRWWDALAVGICILILVGLVLPMLQNGRDRTPSRRAQCHNNLKQLSLATINFETGKKQYPGYQSLFGNSGERGKIGSWVVSLLPHLEETQLRDAWDDASQQTVWEAEYTGAANRELFYPTIPTLICPSDTTKDDIRAPLAYLANAGLYLRPQDPALQLQSYADVTDPSEQSSIAQRAANGVFSNALPATVYDPKTKSQEKVFGVAKSPMRSRDFKDGLSSTILFSEGLGRRSWSDISIQNDQARFKVGLVWLYAGSKAAAGRPSPTPVPLFDKLNVTAPTYDNDRPGSMHSVIFNVAMADGSVRTISSEIDYRVLQALMTPQTAQSDCAGLTTSYILKAIDYE